MKKSNSQSIMANIILKNIRPKKLFHDPWDGIRVIVGIFIATLIGFILKNPDLQALLTVGAFLAGILILIPHHSNRAVIGINNSVLLIIAFFMGALLHSETALLYIIFFVLIFFSGMLRKIGIAVAIKALILSIFLLASAQMSTNLKVGMMISMGIGAGVLITLVCQILPPYTNKFQYEKTSIANVFKELAIDAKSLIEKKRNTKAYLESIHIARNSLDKLDKNSRGNVEFFFQLVAKAEIIEDYFNFIYLKNVDDSQMTSFENIGNLLMNIWNKLNDKSNKDFLFEEEFEEICNLLDDNNFDIEFSLKSKINQLIVVNRKSHSIFKTLMGEMNFKSPIFIQSIRLAVFVMIATIAGDILNYFPSISVPGHGFWISLTTAIVLFPDYVDTFTRGVERSMGTVIGAILGYGISLLPLGLLGHSIMVFILLCGYVVFRSSGQAWIMLWVVAWLCNLSVLHNVAIPRAIDTIVGGVIALIACVIWPTWNTKKIDKLLSSWIKTQGKYINTIIASATSGSYAEREKLKVIRHRSNLVQQQLETNIKKAKYEPVFLNSRWSSISLDKLIEIVVHISYKISSLNITNKKFNYNDLGEKMDSSMNSLSNMVIARNINDVEYEYSIENLKIDIEGKAGNSEFKGTLRSLVSDIEALESIIKSME